MEYPKDSFFPSSNETPYGDHIPAGSGTLPTLPSILPDTFDTVPSNDTAGGAQSQALNYQIGNTYPMLQSNKMPSNGPADCAQSQPLNYQLGSLYPMMQPDQMFASGVQADYSLSPMNPMFSGSSLGAGYAVSGLSTASDYNATNFQFGPQNLSQGLPYSHPSFGQGLGCMQMNQHGFGVNQPIINTQGQAFRPYQGQPMAVDSVVAQPRPAVEPVPPTAARMRHLLQGEGSRDRVYKGLIDSQASYDQFLRGYLALGDRSDYPDHDDRPRTEAQKLVYVRRLFEAMVAPEGPAPGNRVPTKLRDVSDAVLELVCYNQVTKLVEADQGKCSLPKYCGAWTTGEEPFLSFEERFVALEKCFAKNKVECNNLFSADWPTRFAWQFQAEEKKKGDNKCSNTRRRDNKEKIEQRHPEEAPRRMNNRGAPLDEPPVAPASAEDNDANDIQGQDNGEQDEATSVVKNKQATPVQRAMELPKAKRGRPPMTAEERAKSLEARKLKKRNTGARKAETGASSSVVAPPVTAVSSASAPVDINGMQACHQAELPPDQGVAGTQGVLSDDTVQVLQALPTGLDRTQDVIRDFVDGQPFALPHTDAISLDHSKCGALNHSALASDFIKSENDNHKGADVIHPTATTGAHLQPPEEQIVAQSPVQDDSLDAIIIPSMTDEEFAEILANANREWDMENSLIPDLSTRQAGDLAFPDGLTTIAAPEQTDDGTGL